MSSAIDKARQTLIMDGHGHLAPLIHGDDQAVVRPCRALERDEAVAMMRAWRAAYAHLPSCICVDDGSECPYNTDCAPDLSDEREVIDRLDKLSRPLSAHSHRAGEICSWPKTRL